LTRKIRVHVGALIDANAERRPQTIANDQPTRLAKARCGGSERRQCAQSPRVTKTQIPLLPPRPARRPYAKVTPSGPSEPPRISLRFDSAAGPLTGVLMDEHTGHVQWFMGWLELIRAIEAILPWRDATLSDDAGALCALVARACVSGRSAAR
jgi:hypothetical protein